MNVKQASDFCGKSIKTVKRWCARGYIRGVKTNDDGSYDIPLYFRMPYPHTANVRGEAIYLNIVKAVKDGYDVIGKMYGISEELFDEYCIDLIDAGVIEKFKEPATGIVYLKSTLNTSKFANLRKNRFMDTLQMLKPDIKLNLGTNIMC